MLHLEKEQFGKLVKVFDGVWIVATRHRPGLSKYLFEINNRSIIFRLTDEKSKKPLLAVFNATDPEQAIKAVHGLEKETGLAVKYIISPGGAHHIILKPWHDEFTQAQILVGPVRIPHTQNGKKLMKLSRVSAMNLGDPLPMFKHELDAVLFHGLNGPDDRQTPGEDVPDTRIGFIRGMIHIMTKTNSPADELWLYHIPSKTIIAGENLGWYYTKETLQGQPFMLRAMIKPDKLVIQTMARKVADPKLVAECWQKILAWPANMVMTYHELPGIAFQGDGQAALTEAVKQVNQL